MADVTAVEVAGLGASLGVARASLRAAVDGLHASVSSDGFGWALDAEVAETLVELVELRRRLDAISGDIAARVAGSNTFAEAGFRTASAWLRSRTNESFAGVKRTLEAGDWLGAVPVMGAAWREGSVSRAHVAALVEAHSRFPRCSAGLTQIEAELTAVACDLDPKTFSRILMTKLHEIDPDAVDDAEAKRRRRDVGLHVSTTIDGFVAVNGLLTPEVGQQLISALASASDALRRRAAEDGPGSTNADNTESATDSTDAPYACTQDGCPGPAGDLWAKCDRCHKVAIGEDPDVPVEVEQPLSKRNLDALAYILDAAAAATGDFKLPDVGGARPVVQVSIDSESLIAHGASAPGWITSLTGQTVTPVSAAAVRRLACDSVRQILLLDPRGHLDAISALERVVPLPMRRAITIRDDGRCRFPGCTHAIREVHHIKFWQHGGKTTTDNLVGLCSHHHHLVHDKGWTLSGDPNYRLTFTDPLKREWHSDPPLRQ
jgi:5-methylcytosine-specific restriction endonuclease McrA